ncbi:MAG: hypothetical protein JST11_18625 [Acidobacteria bacterium]|nr:hypothetical protein [Acidobacteriota bacterium]
MSFQWLHMRIQEEKDRRQREATTLERLPQALEELYEVLKQAIQSYAEVFGANTVDITLLPSRIKITTREQREGGWQNIGKVELTAVPEIPGFRVERGDYSLAVEVGLLPSQKLFYRDREQDVYLTMEELTRRILDRVLFPKLRE